MQDKIKLTKKEEDILAVLWDAGKPLAVSEICEHGKTIGIDLNYNSVRGISKQMLEKQLLKVGFFTQVNTVFARALEPAITPDELTLSRINSLLGGNSPKRTGLIASLLESENLCDEELDSLIVIMEGMKKK
jgi:predicted transcriptional regulator